MMIKNNTRQVRQQDNFTTCTTHKQEQVKIQNIQAMNLSFVIASFTSLNVLCPISLCLCFYDEMQLSLECHSFIVFLCIDNKGFLILIGKNGAGSHTIFLLHWNSSNCILNICNLMCKN